MIGREREKKILVLNSVRNQPDQENSKKKEKKIKKLKNLFPELFLKTGVERIKKREKNFNPNSVHTQPELEN